MPRMIALKTFNYGTRKLRADDAFDASESDSRILGLARLARTESASEAKPARRYRRRDMQAQA